MNFYLKKMSSSNKPIFESSSSDESDHGVERYRNVHKLLVTSEESQRDVDENYAYKQKLGDLVFNSNFEGGNLGGVKQLNRYEYDLLIRPDVSNARHSIWFNFTVSNQRPNQCVIFNFTNLSEKLSLFSEVGLTPVARSRLVPNWVRLKKNQVFYHRTSDNNKYQLSIAFRFTYHDDEHQFALFYPYTLSTLDNFITRWTVHLKRCELMLAASAMKEHPKINLKKQDPSQLELVLTSAKSKTKSSARATGEKNRQRPRKGRSNLSSNVRTNNSVARFEVYVLTQSVLSKPIYELNVLSSSKALHDRSQLIIIGRASGNFESISSLVCQGLLDFMLSDDQIAMVAREHFNLVIFPMLDPDSIWVGNSRTDLMGQRSIDHKIMGANPSLYRNYRLAVQRIEHICNTSRGSVAVIELGVNPELIGSRIIGTFYADSMRMEKHLQLPRLLSRFSDGFYLEKCRFFDCSMQRDESLFGKFGLK
jgi:hypothetical protein